MNYLELARMTQTAPFVPFEIQLSSGATYHITHPECLVVGRNTSYIFRPSGVPGVMEDDWARIANLHITHIRPIQTASA